LIPEFDVVSLAAGKNESATVKTLLDKRYQSLGIRPVRHHPLVHPRRDPGCLNDAAAILQTFVNRAAHALVLFDWEGSGREDRTASELESDVEQNLEKGGWQHRCAAIVIAPELETWLFTDSPHIPRVLGVPLDYQRFIANLVTEGVSFSGQKPSRPKEVIESLLMKSRIQRSSSLYSAIAEKVSLARCQDRSFLKLKTKLKEWFGE
jgi:hypothetical protein